MSGPGPGGIPGGPPPVKDGIFCNRVFPNGPRVAPAWGYPLLPPGGPFVAYPYLPGYGGFGYPTFLGYGGRFGTSWSNGLSLYSPPVPVYGPIPGVFGNNDLAKQWWSSMNPALAGYGWHGLYNASPRPHPLSVSAWPRVEPFVPASAVPPPGVSVGGCLILSVKVPQPTAEILVDGRKTQQTGTDRTFESPPLATGQKYKYTVTARWLENGQVVEMSKEVTGVSGEIVRVDFDTQPLIATGK